MVNEPTSCHMSSLINHTSIVIFFTWNTEHNKLLSFSRDERTVFSNFPSLPVVNQKRGFEAQKKVKTSSILFFDEKGEINAIA